MSGVLNDCDALLQGAAVRIVNLGRIQVSARASAPGFHLNAAGVPDFDTIDLTAALVGVTGAITWGATGGTLTSVSGATAKLRYADVVGPFVTVTASVTFAGQTFTGPLIITITKDGATGASTYTWTKYSNSSSGASMQDSPAGMSYIGQAFNKPTATPSTLSSDYTWTLFRGADGTSPPQTGTAYLYRWSTTAPAKPNANSTFTWASGANTAYAGSDGWYIASALPANPGTPGMKLYVASIGVSAAYNATTSSVGYASSVVIAHSNNGADGVTGMQAGEAVVYQWAATLPSAPVGSATLTYATGDFGAAPTNWQLTPGTSPTPGYTLWKARVGLVDSASVAATTFDWATKATITAAGFAGPAGTPAMWVDISSTSGGQAFTRPDSTATYAPTSITLTATPYGGAASAYQWQYWSGAAWTNISGATAATTDIASGSFTGSRVFRVQATIAGTVYTDEFTLVQLTGGKDGASAISGFLTNESATLSASSTGTVSDLSPGGGTFKVYDGIADKTGNAAVTYSVFSETGCDVSITAAGVYSVVSMASDQGTAVLQAVYGGVTLQKQLNLAKAKAGTSTPGAEGASYVTAYCASTTATTSTAPAATAGKTSVPAVNGGGITGTWTKTVPTLTAGQFMYQVDGIYNPGNDTVTWSIPYWSSLKVGSLSAITANLGAVTAGDMHSVSMHGGSFTSYAWPATGSGFYLGPEGLKVGTTASGRYFNADQYGDVYAPGFTIISGAATFSGALSAASGTLGSLTLAAGGNVRSSNSTGWGYWRPAGGGNVMYLGAEGAQFGNYNDGQFLHIYADGKMYMPGFQMENKQLTLTSPVIVSPNISSPFSVSLTALTAGNQTNGSTVTFNKDAVLSGGVAPFRYLWSLQTIDGTLALTSDPSAQTATIRASGNRTTSAGFLWVLATDANGMTKTATSLVNIVFGDGALS